MLISRDRNLPTHTGYKNGGMAAYTPPFSV